MPFLSRVSPDNNINSQDLDQITCCRIFIIMTIILLHAPLVTSNVCLIRISVRESAILRILSHLTSSIQISLTCLTLFSDCSFDASKSTKGASKLRRDLINSEIANLRDLLPLPSSTRQRLSQLQLMALVCVYVRKANYFHHGECSLFHTMRCMCILSAEF